MLTDRPYNPQPRARGFTLIELMIAMGIFLIISAIMVGVLRTTVKNWRETRIRKDLFERAVVAIQLAQRPAVLLDGARDPFTDVHGGGELETERRKAGVGRRHGQPDAPEDRQVDQVVADVTHGVRGQRAPGDDLLENLALIVDLLVHLADVEFRIAGIARRLENVAEDFLGAGPVDFRRCRGHGGSEGASAAVSRRPARQRVADVLSAYSIAGSRECAVSPWYARGKGMYFGWLSSWTG